MGSPCVEQLLLVANRKPPPFHWTRHPIARMSDATVLVLICWLLKLPLPRQVQFAPVS